MAITPQWKDELRARITLSTLVQRSVKLTRAGREWKGCCPFHEEKTPSFYVNDQKQFYHCFGCGAHGDAISWMVDQQGLQFMDAVKELAGIAGMEVPAPDPVMAKRAEQRASLIDVTEAAQKFFVTSLAGPSGGAAREYLQRRGFSPQVMAEFGFGWAPDDRQALPKALQQFGEDMLEGAGMRAANEQGERYDRFRGRVMLPIQDARGRVIAFGGRILDKRDGVAKYLNSPDTDLFDKGRTLYNLHRAAPASRQSGRVVVVEGYMDVIALANAGINDAVAPLGTALTEMQLELLWRMVEVPVLCFDGDAAGQRAAMRAIARALPMLAPMRSLGIVRLPAGLDPDDLIKQQGAKAMERLLAKPQDIFEFLWEFEKDSHPSETMSDVAELEARLVEKINSIADKSISRKFFGLANQRIRQLQRALNSRDFKKHAKKKAVDWQAETNSRINKPALERFVIFGGQRQGLMQAVLAGLARYPGQIARHTEALISLARLLPEAASAIESLLELAETLDSREATAIWQPTQGQPAPSADIRYAFLEEGTDPDAACEELAEAVSLLVERPALEAALAATIARFDSDPEGSFAEQTRLRAQLLATEERLKAFGRRKAATPAKLEANTDDTA